MFDTEVRSITSHVLFPVGERATKHVFANMTPERPETVEMEELHATEVRGSGWLVYPIKEPADWTDEDESDLVSALKALLATDYRQEAELGRFLPGDDVWRVR
jgi:uracil-DNA glycosylase